MKCPNCGNKDGFWVGIQGKGLVTKGGAGDFRDFSDIEFSTDDKYCECDACGHGGDYEEFEDADDD